MQVQVGLSKELCILMQFKPDCHGGGNATHDFLLCCCGLSDLCLLFLDLGQQNHWLLEVHPPRVLEHLLKVEIALKGTQGLDPPELHSKAWRKERRAQRKQVKLMEWPF